MRRTVNQDGTVTWKIFLAGESNRDLEKELAGLNANAVVIEKETRYGKKTYVEFTTPLDYEDIKMGLVMGQIQIYNYVRGWDSCAKTIKKVKI